MSVAARFFLGSLRTMGDTLPNTPIAGALAGHAPTRFIHDYQTPNKWHNRQRPIPFHYEREHDNRPMVERYTFFRLAEIIT